MASRCGQGRRSPEEHCAKGEREDGYAEGLSEACSCGDGGGENAAQLDVVALKRLMGHRSAVAVAEGRTLAAGAGRGQRRRCRACGIPA